MKPLVVVDVQNDCTPRGRLTCPGGHAHPVQHGDIPRKGSDLGLYRKELQPQRPAR